MHCSDYGYFSGPQGRPAYIPQLDGLRACAVGAVLLLHFHPNPGSAINLAGHQGVRLFFVLSGFLITGILLGSRSLIQDGVLTAGQALKTFYYRRALRIFPAYYALLVVLVVLRAPDTGTYLEWHLTYTTNFLVWELQRWPIPTGHLWSLAVEEQFYLLWPALCLLIPQRALAPAATVGFLSGVLFHVASGFYGFSDFASALIPGALDALGAGSLVAIAGHRTGYTIALNFLAMLTAIMLPIIWLFFPHARNAEYVLTEAGLACVYAALIRMIALGKAGWSAPLNIWPLGQIGKISYGIYLYHLPVAWLLGPAVQHWSGSGLLPGAWSSGLVYTGSSVLVAAISWRFLERPILALREQRYAGANVAASTSDSTSGCNKGLA